MNTKNKLLSILLIFVFIASISAVVAEDSIDADELAIDDVDEVIAASDETNEPIAAEDDEETAAVDDTDDATDEENDNLTSIAIKVDVLDKNPKVGDEVRIKVTVNNWGDYPADNVIAGFSFTDLDENLDSSFELIDDGGYAVTQADGGYTIDFGFLGAGETQEVILIFLATESGSKKIVASVVSDNTIMEPDSYYETTITVSDNPAADNTNKKDKGSTSKTLPATGNPLALLALSLFCIVPYYRRK